VSELLDKREYTSAIALECLYVIRCTNMTGSGRLEPGWRRVRGYAASLKYAETWQLNRRCVWSMLPI